MRALLTFPTSMRLWQGDSVGRWEGDTLVIDTTNLNGKTWLNEGGEIVSYAEHVVERYTPAGPDTLNYQATVTDPVVYTRPWTIAFQVKRKKAEMFETACHEEDRDLPQAEGPQRCGSCEEIEILSQFTADAEKVRRRPNGQLYSRISAVLFSTSLCPF